MSAQPSTPLPALSQADAQVALRPDAITAQYQQALADETERRILAEAMVQQLLRERAELRQTLLELAPEADSEDGDGHA